MASSSKIDLFSNFSCLDDIIQVIHQGSDKFVLTSSVTKDAWEVHVSHEDRQGRCWKGQWQESDVRKIVGTKASEKMLHTFSGKLLDTIIKGDICIGEWNSKPNADINLTLGPSAKKPLHISLIELSATDSAAYATRLLLKVAQNAQSRQCRLLATAADAAPAPQSSDKKRKTEAESESEQYPPRPRGYRGPAEILRQHSSFGLHSDSQATEVVKPPPKLKGASLANPNKKARRYQKLEFVDSDEEEEGDK
ncbi:hypothetical protein FB107DRAFT_211767 [Schizophyllum commune]